MVVLGRVKAVCLSNPLQLDELAKLKLHKLPFNQVNRLKLLTASVVTCYYRGSLLEAVNLNALASISCQDVNFKQQVRSPPKYFAKMK